MSDNWVDDAKQEVTALQAAKAADPKVFFGNRVRGMGEGLARVKALRKPAADIAAALADLDRVL
jgi:hypothetical protein